MTGLQEKLFLFYTNSLMLLKNKYLQKKYGLNLLKKQ